MANEATLSNQPTDEMARLARAASEALTDNVVERLSITGANALEVVDHLNDPDTREAVHTALQRLTDLHRSGALNTLFDLVVLLHGARDALTDNMVERLFGFAEQMLNTLGSEDLATLTDVGRTALREAAEETAGAAPRGGLLATISMMSRPETQRSLEFMLAFATKLRAHCED